MNALTTPNWPTVTLLFMPSFVPMSTMAASVVPAALDIAQDTVKDTKAERDAFRKHIHAKMMASNLISPSVLGCVN